MLIVSWFICGFLYALFYCYVFNKLTNQKSFHLNSKISILLVIFGLLYIVTMKYSPLILRPYLIHLLYYSLLKINYRKSFFQTLIGLFCCILIVLTSELLYGIFTVILLKINISNFNNIPYGYFISNILILFISLIIFSIKKIKNLLFYILNWYNKNEFKSLIIFVMLVLSIAIFILYNNFINVLPPSVLVFTNIFCIGVFVFVVGFFKEKSNNNKILIEYDQLLNYIKVYEDEIEEKSKNQHEYNNQLIVIKSLIGSRNKKAKEYIDKQLKNEIESEDRSWIGKLKYVPQGGLKGLIYYKIQEMLKNNVIVFVDISPQLQEVNNSQNVNKYLEDISRIVGVYLDNAIQAVNELSEKYIILEIYLEDDNIVFSLSNNYKNKINISEVDMKGYTTKGFGHGYGLSLVKDILSKNDVLTQKRELNGIYFVQKLYIKQ